MKLLNEVDKSIEANPKKWGAAYFAVTGSSGFLLLLALIES